MFFCLLQQKCNEYKEGGEKKKRQSIPVNNSCEGKKLNWRLKWGRLKVTAVIQVGGNVDWTMAVVWNTENNGEIVYIGL